MGLRAAGCDQFQGRTHGHTGHVALSGVHQREGTLQVWDEGSSVHLFVPEANAEPIPQSEWITPTLGILGPRMG